MIVIDMDMPSSCYECRFNSHCDACEGYQNWCVVLDMDIGYDDSMDGVETPKDHRHEKCPLTEVGGHRIEIGDGLHPSQMPTFLNEVAAIMPCDDVRMGLAECSAFLFGVLRATEGIRR